jgi:uncharacterized SAM-binding protein YcdF (DUF218 family)
MLDQTGSDDIAAKRRPLVRHKGRALWRATGRFLRFVLATFGLFVLVLFYSPLADYVVRPLWVPPDVAAAPAIVVLAAYVSSDGVLNDSAMRRVHTASRLYRDGLSPLIIISGGNPARAADRQPADFMAQFARELGVPTTAILLEKASADTHASAVNVSALCRQRGIERVLLVTDAVHMRRAVGAFRAQRLATSPAPADPWALNWEAPDIRLRKFWAALHEYGGLLYYWWKEWI